jgi:lipopolysaccharide transport system ATP-binding protein
MKPAIRVDRLSKQYHLGARNGEGYQTLRESIMGTLATPWRRLQRLARGRPAGAGEGRDSPESFWALQDVSFEIQPGEVVGIIGRNGAGKSTLLKIISRIVEPTAGRVEARGRLGSLLEVGTGFHQELTGRENIYLNGSILGMSRKEINRKFNEIVAFSEVEQFLDTPVKRYSSGMYVRLAFAVAAHLEPEILLVDEVLAVGDIGFQRRCLRKMNDISQHGRTILYVSHNMASIRTLCKSALLLEQGQLIDQGEAAVQVARYCSRLRECAETPLAERTDREGNGLARIVSVRLENELGEPVDQLLSGLPVTVVLSYTSRLQGVRLRVGISCWTQDMLKLLHLDSEACGAELAPMQSSGQYRCHIPKLPLPPGSYLLNTQLAVGTQVADHVYSAAKIEVHGGDYYQTGKPTPTCGAVFLVDHSWS